MGFGGIGFQELLLIFLLVLLLFGAKRLPEVGKAMGKGIREFKRATKEIRSDIDLEEYEKKDGAGKGDDEEKPKEGEEPGEAGEEEKPKD